MTDKYNENQNWIRLLARRAWHRQGEVCLHCQRPITLDEITADHYPLARYQGGTTRHDNIVASCGPCNNTRNAETNRHNGRLDTTVGDTTHRSPFEVLKGRV